MIKLLLLEGCSKCKNLKNQLDINKINHTVVYCDNDPNICDYVELLINSYEYPMVLNVNSKDEIKEIFYITSEYSRLKENTILDNGINTLAFHSIDQLIKFIIK